MTSLGDFATDPGFGSDRSRSSVDLSAGQTVGRFRLLEMIGEGGMGVVWRAEDSLVGGLVAVKVIRSEFVDGDLAQRRFLEEIHALRKLNHPGIVRIHDGFEDRVRGMLGFSMECLDGHDLRSRLRVCRCGLPVAEARTLFSQLLAAVNHAHRNGVIHRDLKPENLFVTSSGLKILDFGLARSRAGSGLTGQEVALGSLIYAAPEQCRGAGQADARSDIFSLGVILQEVLTGEAPQGTFDPAHATRPELPEELHAIVSKAMHHKPQRRFQSVAEFSEAFQQVWSDAGVGTAARSSSSSGAARPTPTAKAAPISSLRAGLADVIPKNLLDLHSWSQSNPVDQDRAIGWIERRLGRDFEYARTGHCHCAGLSYRIATFRHPRSGLELNLLPGGVFRMGAFDGDAHEEPVHEVRVAPILIGRFPVRQRAWDRIGGVDHRHRDGPDLPIEGCTWSAVTAWLDAAGGDLRLPTEAEWEYACRAGAPGPWCTGESEANTWEATWHRENSGGSTRPVGTRSVNAFGLADMHGNVWEWCQDVWHETYDGAPSTGAAWTTAGDDSRRVCRGGSSLYSAVSTRSSQRNAFSRDYRSPGLGFRVARSAVDSPRAR